MSERDRLDSRLNQVQRIALITGAVALVLWLIGLIINPARFVESYLIGYLFWLGAALGSLAFIMLYHLTGGRWAGAGLRRWFEASAQTLPLMAILFLPILIGMQQIYPWARPGAADHNPILAHKVVYLNVPAFIVRAAIYFMIWIGLALLYTRWALRALRNDARAVRFAERFAGPGMVLYVLTITFAAFDWAMTLDSHWYSTIWGFQFVASQALTAMSIAVLFFTWMRRGQPLRPREADQLHDLGNLMLTLVSVWGYLSLMQFLIIWAGNVPEHVVWYAPRVRGAWGAVALFLIIFHFAIPFAVLLGRSNKRRRRWMAVIALWVFVAHVVNMLWVIVPSLPREAWPWLDWRDVLSPIAIGGIWLAACIWLLRRRPSPTLEAGDLDPVGGGH